MLIMKLVYHSLNDCSQIAPCCVSMRVSLTLVFNLDCYKIRIGNMQAKHDIC